jgi:ribonuclease J
MNTTYNNKRKRRRPSRSPQKKLKFIPLGGVEDINRNCYVIEYGNDIVVMDMGFSFPDDDLFGVDYIIPDVTYLKRRKERIKGIVLSHAHLDHVGAIPYVIEELGFPPVYGREFTTLFLSEKLKEFGLDKRIKLITMEPKQVQKLGSFDVRLIPITHAIPQSSSIEVSSPAGTIVYTGDYKFDEAPVRESPPDYGEFKRIGERGIQLACMDSTNVYEEGKAKTETEVAAILDTIVRSSRGRVLAATFSSLGSRLHSLVEIAKKYDRKIVVTGRSMKTMIDLLRQIGYVDVSDKLLISEKNMKGIPDDKLLILTTGTQGEEMAALSRMSRGEHRGIRIKETDTVILSSSVIPGNQGPVQNLIDDLLRLGARVMHQSFMDVHTSGHGYQEDMRKMFDLLQPEFVMPVHGYRSFIDESAYLLHKWGMKKEKILHPETCQTFEWDEKGRTWKKGEKFDCHDIYVEGPVVGETDAKMISDRRKMSESGVVVVSIPVDPGGKLEGQPIVTQRGVVNETFRKNLLTELENNVSGIARQQKDLRSGNTLKMIRKTVEKTIGSQVGKEPIVLVEVI